VLFVVVGFVVIMVGALGIVGWQSMRKYIALSKQAEAVHTVNEIARDASTAWTRESPHKLCDSASYPVPASIVAVSGKKYMSNMTEWRIDAAADKGFACLKFEMALPQYYQYDYELDSPSSFTAIAHGDLDADGVTSTFTQHGTVRGNGIALDSLVRKNPEE
jgi:hypothetical protein